jgi:prefoldin subunit 5
MALDHDELDVIKTLVIRLHREMHNPGYIAAICRGYDIEDEYERAIELLDQSIEQIKAKSAAADKLRDTRRRLRRKHRQRLRTNAT